MTTNTQFSTSTVENASSLLEGIDRSSLSDRLRDTIDLHLHPQHGSLYWLKRQERLNLDIVDRIRSFEDLPLLEITDPSKLASHSVWDFFPQGLWSERSRCIVSESGGTTGKSVASAFFLEEFQQAFIAPFLEVVESTGFPTGVEWLWIGPTGPHIIGKVVRELARKTKCPDPWSVDFDPRWAKKLVAGSFASKRYLDHVVEQSLTVLEREEIHVIFTTPVVLAALSSSMSDRIRERMTGVHYGGMTITAEEINRFRSLFPNAVHLSGYGNSLCGVALEADDVQRKTIDYFPSSPRLIYQTVELSDDHIAWSPTEIGRRGRVMFHRFDRSCFLPNVLERDEAETIPANLSAKELGWNFPGLRDPGPSQNNKKIKVGLY